MYYSGTKKQKGMVKKMSPTRVIVLGYGLIIFLGGTLLSLPISAASGNATNFVDALFTATSAVCVTGLVVVNTLNHWSALGKVIIISLIQIGGLGFMTIFTMFMIAVKKRVTLRERILIQESLNQNSFQGIVKLVKKIIIGTLIFESVGAIILAIRFAMDYGIFKGIYMGVFHSISAFCNAGFDIIGDSSLTPYAGDIAINCVIMSLIVLGGLGFTVWADVYRAVKIRKSDHLGLKATFRHLNLHSKMALTITLILIVGGAIFFFLFEYSNPKTMMQMNFKDRVLASSMQSVTARTAGFNSISQGGLTYASKFMTIILMFIGGSPAGTAGGIKTVTLGVLVMAVISVIKGKDCVQCYHKTINFDVLQKALAVFIISFGAVIGVTMLLTVTERNMAFDYEFMDLLYETVSALGTVGVTTGITPYLSVPGRIIIATAMFMGRVGPISIVMALTKKETKYSNLVQYPEERIIVG